ncbi:MAG: XisH family protein [Leptospiraceae bacterium]|nr:XisH family protein [Leptospiraceae bacterium]MCP5496284.1 XisH family protein [Leptospiraceae bacterium]
MSAKDMYHNSVRTALEKDDWLITNDPLHLGYSVGDKNMYVDLGAEKLISAKKGNVKIAVEVKSFLSHSIVNDFHLSIGQYVNYRALLKQMEPERKLYLAITDDTFLQIEESSVLNFLAKANKVKFIAFNNAESRIVKWKK